MPPRRTSAPVRVLVVGPRHAGAHSRGGMATVTSLMREQRDPRVRIRTVATFVDDPRALRLAVGVSGVVHAVALLLARRCDVLHVHLAHRGSVVRKAVVLHAARLAGVPAIVHAHSFDFAGWFDGLGPRGRSLVRRSLPAARWIVLGDALARDYAERLELTDEQVVVLRNPAAVAPQRTVRPLDADPVRIVFLGRHGERKGSYDLLAALPLLAATGNAWRLVAAGDGETEAVRAEASRLGLDATVDVRGWIDPAHRDALLAASHVFVLPSRDEGLPMALLEAMGAGLAPVVTPVGAMGEVVTDGTDALVVPVGDPAALAAALRTLIDDAALRSRIAAGAADTAARHGVTAWFDDLVAQWTSVARSPRD